MSGKIYFYSFLQILVFRDWAPKFGDFKVSGEGIHLQPRVRALWKNLQGVCPGSHSSYDDGLARAQGSFCRLETESYQR